MQNDDQYMERTPDLIAKVRQMREAAEKEMNRFTRLADYDVRRVVGQKPADTAEAVSPQTSIEFSPEQKNDSEAQP
jgi:Spy/CpxP family protein refolding chaperone